MTTIEAFSLGAALAAAWVVWSAPRKPVPVVLHPRRVVWREAEALERLTRRAKP
jgi:predicted DNA-binding transcriptional regulator AlpA